MYNPAQNSMTGILGQQAYKNAYADYREHNPGGWDTWFANEKARLIKEASNAMR